MSNFNRSMDLSETSTTEERDDKISEEEKDLRIFVTQMLKSRIFLGHFQERRLVNAIQSYRDVIVVNDSEHALKKDIDLVRRKLRSFYGNNVWIGLTAPDFVGTPLGHSFWVESTNHTLGSYWYIIKGIRFLRNEVIVRIKVVRAMTSNDNNVNQSQQQPQFLEDMTNILQNISWDAVWENVKNSVLENLQWLFTTMLTVNNITEAVTFVSVLLVTGLALSFKALAFLMDFTLKFMRETSILIQSATPVMISVVNMIGKIVGGLYLLIIMMFKGSTAPVANRARYSRPVAYNRRSIDLPGYRASSPIITEIE